MICHKIRVLTAAVPENLGTDVLRAKGGVAICAVVTAIYCFSADIIFFIVWFLRLLALRPLLAY
jgi:hypothetical protein